MWGVAGGTDNRSDGRLLRVVTVEWVGVGKPAIVVPVVVVVVVVVVASSSPQPTLRQGSTYLRVPLLRVHVSLEPASKWIHFKQPALRHQPLEKGNPPTMAGVPGIDKLASRCEFRCTSRSHDRDLTNISPKTRDTLQTTTDTAARPLCIGEPQPGLVHHAAVQARYLDGQRCRLGWPPRPSCASPWSTPPVYLADIADDEG